MKQAITDIVKVQGALGTAHEEIRDLKAKLGTNSSSRHLPPSKEPPGAPSRKTKPSGRKHGAQIGYPGASRASFPPDRVDPTRKVSPVPRPTSGCDLGPKDLVSRSYKAPQVVFPANIRLELTHLPLGSQSGRGLRFTERMLTTIAALRGQGRRILAVFQEALSAFCGIGPVPVLAEEPSG